LLKTYHSEEINRYAGGFVGRAETKYARMHDADRHIHRSEDDYYVVTFTLGGRRLSRDNEYLDPLRQHEALLESRHPVRNVLRDLQDEYSGLGFTEVISGNGNLAYSHVHIEAFFAEKPGRDALHRVRKAHVEHSPVARDISPDGYVTIRHSTKLDYEPQCPVDQRRGPVCGATKYIASQIPHVGGLDQDDNQIEHAAVCRHSSSWDTYLSPRLLEHAECERTEREVEKQRRDLAEKMHVAKVYERTERDLSTSNNYLWVSHRLSSASPVRTDLVRSNYDLLCLDTDLVASNSTWLRLGPRLALLVWLYKPPP